VRRCPVSFVRRWYPVALRADTHAVGLDYTNRKQLIGITAGSVLLRTLVSVRMIYQGVADITKPQVTPAFWGVWVQQDAIPDNSGNEFDPLPPHVVTGVIQTVPVPWNPTFAGSDRAWWVYATQGWVESEAQRDIRIANPYLEFVTLKQPFTNPGDEPPEGNYWVYIRLLFNLNEP
jgi:hypothetical protein